MPRLNSLVPFLLASSFALPVGATTITYSTPLRPGSSRRDWNRHGYRYVRRHDEPAADRASFSGLSGTTTVAHIHCCTASPGTGTIGVAVTPVTLPGASRRA